MQNVLLGAVTPLGWPAQSRASLPAVSRWKHPDNVPRPAHPPSRDRGPLALRLVDESRPSRVREAKGESGRVCLVVHQDVLAGTSAALAQYAEDLAAQGYAASTCRS